MARALGWAAACAVVVALGVGCGTSGPPEPPDEPRPLPPSVSDGGTPAFDAGVPDSDGGFTEVETDGGSTPADGGTLATTVCAPSADGPYWLVEGDSVEFTVRCSTGWSDPAAAFEVSPLPSGASFDAATGAFSWTPALHQAATYTLTLREVSTGEIATVKVGVADRFESSQNTPVKDPASYTEEFGLPVMHLSYEGKLNKEYSPATLVYRGKTYALEAKFRGATSLDFPKRSYTLRFSDDDEFRDEAVGFGNRDRLALVTSFNDNSYVRPRLAMEVWRMMDPDNIRVKSFSAVLYVNGHYRGLYTAMDMVDSDLMRRHGLYKDGHLFKSFHADANFSGLTQEGVEKWAYWQGYEKKEGFPEEGQPGAMDEIAQLTEFVATSSADGFREGLPQRVRMRDYENWWIFVTLILGTDNGAKNAYHYRDPNGGSFRYIPWDVDATFGQNFDTTRSAPTWRSDFRTRNLMFQRILEDPTLIEPIRTRYRALLRDSGITKDKVLEVYDALQSEVHGAALRDEVRWRSEYRSFEKWNTRTDFTSYEEEKAYVRDWIDARWDALQQQLP